MKSILLNLASMLCVTGAFAQTVPPQPAKEADTDKRVMGHLYILEQRTPPPLDQLKVPSGFKIERIAENLGHARLLAVSPEGHLYVTRREQGDVLLLKMGSNGLPSGNPVRVAARPGMHGITFHEGYVYLVTIKEVFKGQLKTDGTFGELEMIIHDLPDGGQHPTRTIQVGPDNMLYIGVGSATNDAIEPNPETATILRGSLDGKSRAIFASGLRDPIGWGWHPVTGELWSTDHGIDWLGDDDQPEELNLVQKGKRYGWPYFYGDQKVNTGRHPPGGITRDEMKAASTGMVMGYTPHSAPMQMSFYRGGQFPKEYQGDAFVSMRGSWNRKPVSGYEIVRIRFKDGKPQKFETFVSGFAGDGAEYGRLCGNVVAKDGSLLFSDDRNGVIYRVSYSGNDRDTSMLAAQVPAGPMKSQNKDDAKEPLAHEILKAKGGARLTVTSPAFGDGKAIPKAYSAYEQNYSPALRWEGAPAGTESFVIFMEDPDAKNVALPVVHWTAWNLPATLTELREALPPDEGVKELASARQGPNFSGRPGYFGPRPPKGDAPHRYFFQVFALDTKLKLLPGSTREQILQACQGHVLATGVFHGTFERPAEPTKP